MPSVWIAWLIVAGLVDVALVLVALRARQCERPRVRLRQLTLTYLALLFLVVVGGAALGVHAALVVAGSDAVDPSQKARLLAKGISEAMNSSAFGITLLALPTLVAFVLFVKSPKESG